MTVQTQSTHPASSASGMVAQSCQEGIEMACKHEFTQDVDVGGTRSVSICTDCGSVDGQEQDDTDNQRLRKLIAQAEWCPIRRSCSWCGALDHDARGAHRSDCPAFSAPGVVR